MQNKNISKKEIKELFKKLRVFRNKEQMERLQKLSKQAEEISQPNDTWIVSDSSSNFPSFNLKKYG